MQTRRLTLVKHLSLVSKGKALLKPVLPLWLAHTFAWQIDSCITTCASASHLPARIQASPGVPIQPTDFPDVTHPTQHKHTMRNVLAALRYHSIFTAAF